MIIASIQARPITAQNDTEFWGIISMGKLYDPITIQPYESTSTWKIIHGRSHIVRIV